MTRGSWLHSDRLCGAGFGVEKGGEKVDSVQSIQEIEANIVKKHKIAFALVEQCKNEGGLTVNDLMQIFKLALTYIKI